ncbi:heterodisulfide reductase subunit C [Candidatus Methanoperedenaceae archaeon GB50]|nr:heterodisulfide reductase subunit C [Candidatus Methanoperedenaceae archaeon GB50]CAD7781259.1 MAG: hypothetical protein KBONHNOK_01602 [Candidatus Methanoperedenaceae archaeon GB50]
MRRMAIGQEPLEGVFEDPRMEEIGLRRCLQCGRCTGSCPARSVFREFSPRMIVLEILEGRVSDLLRGDLIWLCGQCYTCHLRCPRGNSPATVILVLRELALMRGYARDKVRGIAERCGRSIWERGVNFHEEGSRELPDRAMADLKEALERGGYDSFLKRLGVDLS